ncbi:MAG: hypothetical protein ACYS6W_16260, partial [Planctomycetota bacterium]
PLTIEVGVQDVTLLQGVDKSASCAVPTRLTYIVGGWNFCWSRDGTAGITPGCITSQMLGDHTWGSYIDYTMDTTCGAPAATLVSKNNYILFGY